MKIKRNAAALALAAVTALVAPAAPAAASHDSEQCIDLRLDLTGATATACLTVAGHYDPFTLSCSTIYGCWARATVGTHDTASVDAKVCFESPDVAPFCVNVGTGEIPLVAVPPQTICVNDSPWGPACEPHDG